MQKRVLIVLLFLLRSGFLSAQVDLANGLVGDYRFSGDASDLSVSNNDGSVSGATLVADRFGNPNSAYSFDGNDFISFSSDGLENENFTYSVWVNVGQIPASGTASCMVSIGRFQTLLLHNNYVSTDGFTAGSYYSSSSAGSYSTEQFPMLNTWYHLLYMRSNGNMWLYINGVLHGLILTGGNLPYYNNLSCTFGARDSSPIQTFVGKIDDVRIYNRVLSACEIQLLYNGSTSVSDLIDVSIDSIIPNQYGELFSVKAVGDPSITCRWILPSQDTIDSWEYQIENAFAEHEGIYTLLAEKGTCINKNETVELKFQPVIDPPVVTPPPPIIKLFELLTPNGDDKNDVLIIEGIESYPENTITVVNVWQQVVYTEHNYHNTWDGNNLPEGTYYLELELKETKERIQSSFVLRR